MMQPANQANKTDDYIEDTLIDTAYVVFLPFGVLRWIERFLSRSIFNDVLVLHNTKKMRLALLD